MLPIIIKHSGIFVSPSIANLAVFSFNAQSVRNKWNAIKFEVLFLSPDIICICESWLSSTEVDAYAIDSYIGFNSCRVKRLGGGVLLLAWAHLWPLPLSITCDDYDECCIVSIKLECAVHSIVIRSEHRSPKTGVAVSDQLIKHITDIRAKADLFALILTGSDHGLLNVVGLVMYLKQL